MPGELWSRLEKKGFKVLIGEPGEDPLEGIQKAAPCLWVSQTNGNPEKTLDSLRTIREACPALPIVLLSGNPRVDEAVQAIKLGIYDYVPAGVSEDRLSLAIEGALTWTAAGGPRKRAMPPTAQAAAEPIAVDPAMGAIVGLARKIAGSRTTVLIQGESGTGKEVIARFIHRCSDRREQPFVAVNCAALPETLLESELFGHEKGAFTGAVARKKGKFELASGGTLLLDEISETAVSIQAKLLRVLQEREIDRVGGQGAVPVDTRVIATTNRDLNVETKNGNFRVDLFYRLNVVPLNLPPLRDRPDDVVPLARAFLERQCAENGVSPKTLNPAGEDFLRRRAWPGNVRELENLMERTCLLVDADVVDGDDLRRISAPDAGSAEGGEDAGAVVPLKDMERRMIYRALKDHDGNRTHAAKVLGISVRTLRNKLNEYKEEMRQGA